LTVKVLLWCLSGSFASLSVFALIMAIRAKRHRDRLREMLRLSVPPFRHWRGYY
jgi:hypothetical protein